MIHITLLLVITLAVAVLAAPPTLRYYTPLTEEQAAKLASSRERNLWQWSGQTQGDMILTPGQRNGLIFENYRWINNEVPYELDPIFSEAQANQIHEAVRAFAASSCVTVRPRRPDDVDYVYVTGENTGCWSYVGRIGGMQLLNLQTNGCVWDHIIVHEFLHAIGFYHEQSSTERDDYVIIQWENIISGMEYNFDKYGPELITNFGQPYDYLSVMHYDAYSFSSNGLPTILPLDQSYLSVIGNVEGMSEIDINKLNLMYCQ
ncbi:Astacin (Peptidase family M12A) [Popillia japonica]|uniref:Metalloendopeptidase n=1 Tax=Popillia japonica TaxID=7064 RepID=A0AAW1ICL0_POPJA